MLFLGGKESGKEVDSKILRGQGFHLKRRIFNTYVLDSALPASSHYRNVSKQDNTKSRKSPTAVDVYDDTGRISFVIGILKSINPNVLHNNKDKRRTAFNSL
ncbi:hypothetical protein Tco_0469232 [Tanacetum coccineum]